jgi:cyclic pyranopterin phosphate synthase
MLSSPNAIRLIDRFGRIHTSVRVSVTDRCNIRCFYCMPEVDAVFMDKARLLSFEEIERVCRLLVQRCGVGDIRLTGGEPLVRRQLDRLVALIAGIEGLQDLSLTTNGILLADQAVALRDAGLRRINISLDTLDEDVFKRISRRSGLDKTIEGIDRAIECGFESIKLNALAIRGITEREVVRLVKFALRRGVVMRFIEFMPLDADRAWRSEDVLDGDSLLAILQQEFGLLSAVERADPSQPAEEFLVGEGRVGIIRSVTAPFCRQCNRIRLTADGSLRNCLFAQSETPLREAIREHADDEELLRLIQSCVAQKSAAHGIDREDFQPPDRPMYAIGG